jgi:subtilisin family serine protease
LIATIVAGAVAAPAAAGIANVVTSGSEPLLTPISGNDPGDQRLWERGDVVVRYLRGTDAAERSDVRASVDAESAQGLEVARAQLLALPDGTSVRGATADLNADPAVEFAEPNYLYHLDSVSNDTFFNQLWGLNNTGQTITTPSTTVAPSNFPGTADADIDAPEGWDVAPVEGGDASKIVVAVADTGIDYNHPDLAPNMWHNPGEIAGNGIDDDANGFVDDVFGADFKSQFSRTAFPCNNTTPPACADADPIDDSTSNHGTHVSGTIGARGNDGYGITGVDQKVQLMAVKVFDGLDTSSNVSVGNAFAYAGQNGAKVVNASLGGPCPSQLQATAIQNNPNVLFVFAAGNGGPNGIGDNNDIVDDTAAEFSPTACGDTANPSANRHPGQYPCNFNAGPEAAGYTGPAYDFPNVICVAATTNTDARASYSNWGPTSVQIAAPGSQVLSTQPAYQTAYSEGAEDPGFNGRLINQAGVGIVDPPPATTGWQRVASPNTGTYALSESALGTNYPASDPNTLEPASPINLTGKTGCHIDWAITIQTPDINDGLRLRIATGPSNTGPFIGISQAFTGNFASPYVRLTTGVPELNNQAQARYRLDFLTDGDATTGEGGKVDDLAIRCLGGSYTPEQVGPDLIGTHKFFNGTSMATPHVTGVAALIRAKAPALTPAQVIQRITSGGDPSTAFANPGPFPVESGKRLNLLGALNAGSQPVPAAPTITGPSGPTNQNAPTLGLSTDLAGSRFQCALDAGSFGDCTTADSFTPAPPLADGPHELRVRAIGGEGGVSPTSTQALTVDATSPETTIDSGPVAGSTTSDTTPSFGFSSNEAGASFECRFDSAAFAACSGPGAAHTPGALSNGARTFEVRATDAVGNVDGSPAARAFTVDGKAPGVTITKGPKKKSKKTKATFEFKADEAATFTCELDGKAVAKAAGSCSSPTKVKVKKGKHTFTVTATDAVGNKGQASLSWKVKKKKHH